MVGRERIVMENEWWRSHLNAIVSGWIGEELHTPGDKHYSYDTPQAQFRLLIVALGIHAFHLERGHLPTTLSELTPEYLPALPGDPYGNGPFHHHKEEDWEGIDDDYYEVYGVGPNGQDNGGYIYSTYRSDDLSECDPAIDSSADFYSGVAY
jgi:hypothetical protein